MSWYPGLGIEYDPRRIYLDVKRIGTKSPDLPAIRWLEMKTDCFQSFAGMVLGVNVRSRYPFLDRIDHLDFCPFKDGANTDVSYPLNRYGDTENGSVFMGRTFVDRLVWLINGNKEVAKQVEEVLESGKADGKIPLNIEAHGVEMDGVRLLGPKKDSPAFPLEVVLCNLVKVLRAAKYSVGSVMSSVSSRYSMVAIYACNAGNVDISQETVNYLGVPVLYSYDILGGIRNRARSVIVFPQQQI